MKNIGHCKWQLKFQTELSCIPYTYYIVFIRLQKVLYLYYFTIYIIVSESIDILDEKDYPEQMLERFLIQIREENMFCTKFCHYADITCLPWSISTASMHNWPKQDPLFTCIIFILFPCIFGYISWILPDQR